jgi:hypothetical protein
MTGQGKTGREDSGEERTSEVLADATPSKTEDGFDVRTAGPWRYEYDDNGFYCVTAHAAPSPYIVATGGEGDTDKANARLIAAAPDLLAALKAVMDGQIGGSPDLNAERFQKARAVIAKAEGRS